MIQNLIFSERPIPMQHEELRKYTARTAGTGGNGLVVVVNQKIKFSERKQDTEIDARYCDSFLI